MDPRFYVKGAPTWWSSEGFTERNAERLKKLLGIVSTGSVPISAIMKSTVYNFGGIPGFLLHGPPGRGKTALAVGVAHRIGTLGGFARFVDFAELMQEIRATWGKTSKLTTADVMAELYRPDALVVDDVGKRQAPEDQETISVLVNGRINRGKLTILTTNADLDTEEGRAVFAASCDSRVYERFRGFIYNVGGENLRAQREEKQ